jgi:hypothetical protein
MKYGLMIALVAFAPTLVLAQTGLPSGVSSSGKPAGMPPTPTPQTVQNTAKAVETVSGAASITPTPSSEKSSGKSGGGSMKSTYDSCGTDGRSIC